MRYFREASSVRSRAGRRWLKYCITVGCSLGLACGDSVTGDQTVNVAVGTAAKLLVVQPVVNLVRVGSSFQDYNGTVTIQYKVRTGTGSGSATMTVRAGGEFTPSGGPRIANGDLRYACGAPTVGTGCAGVQTVSTTAQGVVVSVGPGVCTGSGCPGANPNSVPVSLTLENSPAYETGQYSSSLIFTFSSL
jgi:hypothetical protein